MATHFSSTPDNYSYGDINALDGVANLSACVWHYQTAGENTGGGAGVSVSFGGKGSVLYFFKNDGGGAIPKQWGYGDGTGTVFGNGSFLIADATWQHLAWTYDGSQSAGSRGQLYLNGATVTKANDTVGATYPSNASNVLFGSAAGGLTGWQGNLAFLKMWTATLTASEMQWEMVYAEPQRVRDLALYIPFVFNTVPGATYDGTNALAGTTGTPATSTVSEPPVIWPAGAVMGHRNTFRQTSGLRRNRFQRLSPKRPLVQYG